MFTNIFLFMFALMGGGCPEGQVTQIQVSGQSPGYIFTVACVAEPVRMESRRR